MELVKRAYPGLTLTHLPYPPSAIGPRGDMQYFDVTRAGPCWDTIVSTQQVGIYVPDAIPQPEIELSIIHEGEGLSQSRTVASSADWCCGADAETTRRGRLALALQEPLTSVARLRANKQIAADAESFRGRIKQVLAAAEQDAKAAGYDGGDIRYALFAVIALIDETVLNCGQAMFAEWSRKPLQQEVFGVHMAGELFFQYLQQLMARQDSKDLADVLEVYSLCLLLGFKGRYSGTHGGDIGLLVRQLAEKIDRSRGRPGEMSPRWRPSTADIGRRRDRWVPRLAVLATVLVLVAAGLFVYFTIVLRSGTSDLQAQVTRLAP